MRKIEYYKYHGLGNDFLVIDLIKQVHFSGKLSKLATAICERTTGVGADGLLALKRSKKAAGQVSIYNSDGSWAEKSGNGLRIAAVHYYLNHSSRKKASFETGAGVALAKIISAGEHSFKVKVSLGSPVFKTKKIPILSKLKFHINCPIKIGRKTIVTTVLSVGNPHTVIFVDDFNFDWKSLGRKIETDRHFPNRTNVEFAKIIRHDKLILNDWERGAGATGSSGTGAAAAVVAGVLNGVLDRQAEVIFPSGSLFIDWDEKDNNIYLTGPVEFICRGQYFL